jgi:TonB family protein
LSVRAAVSARLSKPARSAKLDGQEGSAVRTVLLIATLALAPLQAWSQALTPPASSQPGEQPQHGETTRAPRWISLPSREDLQSVYPSGTSIVPASGRVVMHCRVTATGTLTACAVVSEEPPGAGFGEAALKLTNRFRMTKTTADGLPVEGADITIPIRFTPR